MKIAILMEGETERVFLPYVASSSVHDFSVRCPG